MCDFCYNLILKPFFLKFHLTQPLKSNDMPTQFCHKIFSFKVIYYFYFKSYSLMRLNLLQYYLFLILSLKWTIKKSYFHLIVQETSHTVDFILLLIYLFILIQQCLLTPIVNRGIHFGLLSYRFPCIICHTYCDRNFVMVNGIVYIDEKLETSKEAHK